MSAEHLDVVIVGAGLSGIDAAYWLQTKNPDQSWAIFEARDAIGGTWDLFRYPGIRSDSDMATLGFPFRPWRGEKSIADGADIRAYIQDTAKAFAIDQKVRLRHRVNSASWSTENACWTIQYEADGAARTLTCNFLFMCAGYYDYAEGHAPSWPGMESFKGRVIHPQFWPEDLSVADKKIVVVGSGATAVTLVPALTKLGAEHVTMLQRSPTYIVSRPARDPQAEKLRRYLPGRVGDAAVRWKNVLYSIFVYDLARRKPGVVKQKIAEAQQAFLGPDFDVAKHLTPSYDPWDQRLCLVPDGDLFRVLKAGKASIVTDHIDRFAPDGIILRSGEELAADIIVTATGLKVQMLGGTKLIVDGQQVATGERLLYKGAMLEGVPNFAFAVGYTNASWTLKCDLTSQFVSQLLKHMGKTGQHVVRPEAAPGAAASEPMLDLKSGYIERAASLLPRQGIRAPWKTHQNYLRDLMAFKTGRVNDGVLKFARSSAAKQDAL